PGPAGHEGGRGARVRGASGRGDDAGGGDRGDAAGDAQLRQAAADLVQEPDAGVDASGGRRCADHGLTGPAIRLGCSDTFGEPMPRPPLALAAVLFALSAGPTLAQQTHDTPHVPVPPVRMAGAAEAVDAFHAALRAGDRDAALAVLAEDALIFEAGGAERSRAEYASHHLEA